MECLTPQGLETRLIFPAIRPITVYTGVAPDKSEKRAILLHMNLPMDPQDIQAKVEGFAQKLLEEAHGDPVRALGLLVLVLEGSEAPASEQCLELLTKIRKILLPESDRPTMVRAVQHLAGDMSWEGYQHCVRCGLVLAKQKESERHGFPSGYVYQVGGKFGLDAPNDFGSCDT